jgi:hypothetical protein
MSTTDTDTENPGCLHTTAQLGQLLFGGAIGLYAFIIDLTISSQSLGHMMSPLTQLDVFLTLIFSPLTWVLAGGLLVCSLVADALGGGR